jgi:hypothetical protein
MHDFAPDIYIFTRSGIGAPPNYARGAVSRISIFLPALVFALEARYPHHIALRTLPAMQPKPVTKFLLATKPVTKPTVGGYLYFYTSTIPTSVPSQIYICRLSLKIFRQLRGYLYLPQQMRMRRWASSRPITK